MTSANGARVAGRLRRRRGAGHQPGAGGSVRAGSGAADCRCRRRAVRGCRAAPAGARLRGTRAPSSSRSTSGSARRRTSPSSSACSSRSATWSRRTRWPKRSPGRASTPARSTSSSRTGATPTSSKTLHHGQEGRPGRRSERRHRDHRLVRPRVDGHRVPGHPRLEQPQQVRRPVQDDPSRATRVSSSPATRRSSPTTRRWSRTST